MGTNGKNRSLSNYRPNTTLEGRKGYRKNQFYARKLRKHWREMSLSERKALLGTSMLIGQEIAKKNNNCQIMHRGTCPCYMKGKECSKVFPRGKNGIHFWQKYDEEKQTLIRSNIDPEVINMNDVFDLLNTPEQIVEYNYDLGSRSSRVLIRSNSGICLVLDLDKKLLVTMYYNKRDDNHSTLRETDYINNLNQNELLGNVFTTRGQQYVSSLENKPDILSEPIEKVGLNLDEQKIHANIVEAGFQIPSLKKSIVFGEND